MSSTEDKLLKVIKTFPLQIAEEPASRVSAANAVLKDILDGEEFDSPAVAKVMLFELMSMALCDGSISSIEFNLLKEIQHHCKLEDFIFDDILDRAESVNQEVSKTIAIILE